MTALNYCMQWSPLQICLILCVRTASFERPSVTMSIQPFRCADDSVIGHFGLKKRKLARASLLRVRTQFFISGCSSVRRKSQYILDQAVHRNKRKKTFITNRIYSSRWLGQCTSFLRYFSRSKHSPSFTTLETIVVIIAISTLSPLLKHLALTLVKSKIFGSEPIRRNENKVRYLGFILCFCC